MSCFTTRTQKPSQRETRSHLHPADGVGQHCLGMGVHHAVYAGILLQYLAVDATFFEPLRRVRPDGGRIFDAVFDEVGRRRDEGGGDGAREEECVRVDGVA